MVNINPSGQKFTCAYKVYFTTTLYFCVVIKCSRESTYMFRLWVREFKETHMIKDIVIEDGSGDTRTHKIMNSLEKACREFDLPVPIWLEDNIDSFKKTSKARFRRDSFIEDVPFDYLEILVIEEDPAY